MTAQQETLRRLVDAINGVVRGKDTVVLDALTAVLARGHLLLEDVPGVGKTTLGHAVARALGCTFRRIQFTSDLLPSDILGVNIFLRDEGRFDFRPGPIFASHAPSGALAAKIRARISAVSVRTEAPPPFSRKTSSRIASTSAASSALPATARARVSARCSQVQASSIW